MLRVERFYDDLNSTPEKLVRFLETKDSKQIKHIFHYAHHLWVVWEEYESVFLGYKNPELELS